MKHLAIVAALLGVFAALTATPAFAQAVTLDGNVGNNGQSGNIFQITAINDVIIRQLALEAGASDTGVPVEVWYNLTTATPGDANWTLAGTATVDFVAGSNTTIPVNLDLVLSPAQTIGLCIVHTSLTTPAFIAYTNGPVADISDANLTISGSVGWGGPYLAGNLPAVDPAFTPRVFAGQILYDPIQDPEIDIEHNSASLGYQAQRPVDLGGVTPTAQSETFTINNDGATQTLNLTVPFGLSSTGTFSSGPTVNYAGGTTIAAGASETFTVDFTPTSNFTITITIQSNDPDEPTSTIVITGTLDPEIDVQRPASTSIANGATDTIATPLVVGSANATVWTIENQGGTNLDVTSIAAAPSGVANCTVTASPVLSPSSPIAPLATATFSIDVNPTAPGAFEFTITIQNSDADENPYTIIVQGTGGLSGSFDVGGGAMDFTTLDQVFDDLETFGVAGPVTFNVFNGTYASSTSFEFGHDGTVNDPVEGASATNTITIQAAAGQSPVLSGAAATPPFGTLGGALSTLSINQSFVRLIGLEITGGTDTGILIVSNIAQPGNDIEIRRCRLHGVTAGPAIVGLGLGGNNLNTLVLVNNFFWNNTGSGGVWPGLSADVQGTIVIGNTASGVVLQHNSILHNAATGTAGANSGFTIFDGGFGGVFIDEFNDNIVMCNVSGQPCMGGPGAIPTVADRNVYFFTGGAIFHQATALYPDFASWQGVGLDANGVNADPVFTSTTGGTADLHLQSGSAALNLGVGSTVTIDIDGDTRPIGAAPDAGADETSAVPAPEIDVQRPAGTSIASGATDNVGTIATGGPTQFTYTIENTGTADLTVTSITATPTGVGNCSVVVGALTPASPVPASSVATFTVDVTPTIAGNFEFTITINNDDADEGTYLVIAQGTASAPAPDMAVERPVSTVVPDGGSDTITLPAGVANDVIYTIRNNGTATLNITTPITPAAGAATNCTINSVTQPPATVAAGATATFTINVTPGTSTFSFNVSITNDDPGTNKNPYDFTVNGTGSTEPNIVVEIPAGTTVVNGGIHSLGSVGVAAQNVTVTINNTGNADLVLSANPTATPVSNCTATAGAPGLTTIPASSSTTFTVTVTPGGVGAFSATVTITSNDPGDPTYTITIDGTASISVGGPGGGGGGGCCAASHQDEASKQTNLLALLLIALMLTVITLRRRA